MFDGSSRYDHLRFEVNASKFDSNYYENELLITQI